MNAERPLSPWRYYLVAILSWAFLFALLSVLTGTFEARRLEREFLRTAANIESRTLQALSVTESVIGGLSVALSSMRETDLPFERYARHVLVNHDHVQMVIAIRRVTAQELGGFLEDMRAHYGPDFSLRAWNPAKPLRQSERRRFYYPVSFVAPHRVATPGVLGRELGSDPALRATVKLALTSDAAVASGPVELPGGEAGYLEFQAAFDNSPLAVALAVRADRLLDRSPEREIGIALHHADRGPLILLEGHTPGPLARIVLPTYHDVRPIETPNHPYTLVLEQSVDWHNLSAAPMVPMLALSLLGLPAAAAIAYRRHKLDRERAAHEELLAWQATHDYLTGLPNRQLLRDRFAHACQLAGRQGTSLGLLFVDLDNFKPLNDAHGHDFGDAALITTATRITSALRKGDTVARIGGDEFLVLLEGINGKSDAEEAAEHILQALSPPARFRGIGYQLDASIGIALFPRDGTSFTRLLAHADAAMYQAKLAGGGRYARTSA